MSEIIPAIIPKDLKELEEKLSLLKGLVKKIQIDVLDGTLVSEKSWPYIFDVSNDFREIVSEEKSLPFWENFKFEIDLMVKDPRSIVPDWISAGAQSVIVHTESFDGAVDALAFLNHFRESYPGEGSLLKIELGIAINIETPNSELNSLIPHIDFVQFMGIDKIGAQGRHFDERVVEKIREFKSRFSEIPVSVDGGVNLESAPKLVALGVEKLVVGSAILKSDDIPATIEELRNL